MADKLTPQQQMAVTSRGGKLLVSAAAGSGKTKVLVDRLLGFLTQEHDPANLDEFLIITYTKAAASELRGKIAAKLTEEIARQPENRHLQRQMQRLFLTKISTVHGFCSDLLREYAYKLDVAADFRVADENECREIRETVLEGLLDRAYETAGDDPDFRAFVDTQGVGRSDRQVPELVEKVYDSAHCHLNPEAWLDKCLTDAEAEGIGDAGETVWGQYLIRDFLEYLDCQMAVLRQCAESADSCPGLEKPAVTLRDALYQLEQLRACTTWDDIAAKREPRFGSLRFPTKNNPDPELTERIKAAWSACKDGLRKKLLGFSNDSAQVLADLHQTAAAQRGLVAQVRQFDRDYSAAKRSRRVLDFGDLEHKTLDLLLGKSRSQPTAAAREIGRRYREIMVDEYQDSNGVQDAIFDALTREKQNCFMVGDVKQSIYQFRLADPGIFLEKYEKYVPAQQAEPGQGRKILLSHNFRSGAEVIDAVNDVFHTCMRPKVGGLTYGEAEELREGIPHVPLDDAVELHVIETRDDQYPEEAAFVAERIARMLREGTPVRDGDGLRPVRPEDIVILLRSPGSGGGYFQKALEARGIRCASGGGTDLLQTQEIGTLRAFLQVIWNPRQDIPLVSTLASPIFGFTADELAAIRCRQKKGAFYDALLLSDSPKVKTFLSTLDKLRREARMNPLTALLENCFALTRLDSVYAAMPGGEAKAANIQTFYQLAADFESGNLKDLGQFLDFLDAMEEKGLISAALSPAGCVTIMSIHKSKGLEFPVVILAGLARRLNREDMQKPMLFHPKLGVGPKGLDRERMVEFTTLARKAVARQLEGEMMAEELRLLYVAVTRAKEKLILSCALTGGARELQRLAGDAGCPVEPQALLATQSVGQWVLLCALARPDGEALRRAAECYVDVTAAPCGPAWDIRWVDGGPLFQAPGRRSSRQEGPEADLAAADRGLAERLAWTYPHAADADIPSKLTATQLKGRALDEEVREGAGPATEPSAAPAPFGRPRFAAEELGLTAAQKGTALHLVMQYLDFERAGTREGAAEEIRRLVDRALLTPEQGEAADPARIAAFFASDLGRELMASTSLHREYKFSILVPAADYYAQAGAGEKVLLQGVVDCWFETLEGITVVDFKTDRVTEQTVLARAKEYRPQLMAYSRALEEVTGRRVVRRVLWFFRLDRAVEV